MPQPFYHSFLTTLGGLYVEVEAAMTADGDLIEICGVVQVGHDGLPMDDIAIKLAGETMTLQIGRAHV